MRSTTNNPMGAAMAAVLLVLAGCTGGQSGGLVDDPTLPQISEAGPECQCLLAGFAVAVSAALREVDACEVSADVIEVLDGEERGDIQPGDILTGQPLPCVDLEGIEAGDEVLMLYAPAIVSGPDDAGNTHVTPARVYYAPLGAPIRIDNTDEDLPADRQQALAILLDTVACRAWTMQHRTPPPDNGGEGEGEGEGEGAEPFPVTPEDLMEVDPNAPVSGDAPPDDEEPGAPPTCGI